VLVDGASVGAVTSYTFSNVTANHTISATFAIDTYAITATSGANGSVTPAGPTTVPGTARRPTPSRCDRLPRRRRARRRRVAGPITTYTFSNVTANHTISATFAINTYTLTASAGANGSVTPAGTTT